MTDQSANTSPVTAAAATVGASIFTSNGAVSIGSLLGHRACPPPPPPFVDSLAAAAAGAVVSSTATAYHHSAYYGMDPIATGALAPPTVAHASTGHASNRQIGESTGKMIFLFGRVPRNAPSSR